MIMNLCWLKGSRLLTSLSTKLFLENIYTVSFFHLEAGRCINSEDLDAIEHKSRSLWIHALSLAEDFHLLIEFGFFLIQKVVSLWL